MSLGLVGVKTVLVATVVLPFLVMAAVRIVGG